MILQAYVFSYWEKLDVCGLSLVCTVIMYSRCICADFLYGF